MDFRPGIVRDATELANEGGWFDANLVRFRIVDSIDGQRFSIPEKWGGWQQLGTSTHLGTCRSMHQWTALDLNTFTALGTTWKLYIMDTAGNIYDITPIRLTVVLANNPFQTVATGTSELIVTHTAHGAAEDDFVTFSGSAAFDNYTAAMLNLEFQITDIIDANSYHIVVTGATSSAPGVNGGGAGVTAAYQITTGLDSQFGGTGWGTGTYSRSGYSSSWTIATSSGQVRVWSMDNFGEDLLACPIYAGIYFWDKTSGTGARAVALSSVAGANSVPTVSEFIVVTDERFVIAFGCNQFGASTQDLLAIRWCSQEDYLDWEPRTDNTAGGLRLGDGSQIAAALKVKQGVLTWTDKSLHLMSFVGPPYTYGETRINSNVSIIGPKAAIHQGDNTFWMDLNNFYVYNGSVSALPCPLKAFVFDDFNYTQRFKVQAGANTLYNEIIWFYPSADSTEVDRYVTFNYLNFTWSKGVLARTGWLDRAIINFPMAAYNGVLYQHEYGYDANGAAMGDYLESADMDIDDGDSLALVKRIFPDVRFLSPNDGSVSSTAPAVKMILKSRDFPRQDMRERASVLVQDRDIQKHVRVRGRQIALRVESTGLGVGWRLGTVRLDIQPDGKR